MDFEWDEQSEPQSPPPSAVDERADMAGKMRGEELSKQSQLFGDDDIS